MDKINKLILPATILIASLILGGFIYASQIRKQNSIEKQQQIELQAKHELEQVKLQKDRLDDSFSNNLKCQTLLKDLRQKWDNVVGIYYSRNENTCIVKYTEQGETQEAPVEDMQSN